MRLIAGVERVYPMVDLPVLATPTAFNRARNDVKANGADESSILMQPSMCGPNHPRLFAPVDREFGGPEAAASTSLHFDENNDAAAASNQVDLDPVIADVASIDAIPSARQKGRRTRLADRAQCSSRVFK